MSYIGNTVTTVPFITDTFSGNASAVNFTLTRAPAGTASIAVFIAGVYQPPTNYTLSGTTLTFNSAPGIGTNNIVVLHMGNGSATQVPSDGSVTLSKLSSDSYGYINSAFSAANTGGSGATYANSAFIQANAAFLQANTPDYVANSAASYANSGFAVANSASLYANSAFLKANTPDYVANSAASYANAAFAAANSANSGGSSSSANTAFYEDTFTGDGSTTVFTLSTTANQYTVLVSVNGVLQPNSAYSIIGSNNKITLSEAPQTNDTLSVKKTSGGGGSGSSIDSWVRDTANAAFIQANSAFTVANTAYTSTITTLSPFLLMGA